MSAKHTLASKYTVAVTTTSLALRALILYVPHTQGSRYILCGSAESRRALYRAFQLSTSPRSSTTTDYRCNTLNQKISLSAVGRITAIIAFPYDTEIAWDVFGLLLTPSMIAYLAQKAIAVVPGLSCSTSHANWTHIPPVYRFIKSVVMSTNVPVPTLATSLVYMRRLQRCLPSDAKGLPSTPHRIFLAALNLAAKNVHDVAPFNRFWSEHSFVAGYDSFGFSIKEVNLMERQLLSVLNWDVRINTLDFTHQLRPLLMLARIQPSIPHESPTKISLERKMRKQRYPSLRLGS
jgi:hypothetical protein